jgi:hypothetical protein
MSQLDSAYPLSHGLTGEQLELLYLKNIEQSFWKYDKEHPGVYRKLVNLARTVKAAGYDHYSMDALFHRLRWHYNIEHTNKEPFKLNDHHTAFYARLIMSREPDLCDMFEIRVQRSKRK